MDNDNRTERINVALSPDERAWVDEQASRRGMSKSAVMREALLKSMRSEQQQDDTGRDT